MSTANKGANSASVFQKNVFSCLLYCSFYSLHCCYSKKKKKVVCSEQIQFEPFEQIQFENVNSKGYYL